MRIRPINDKPEKPKNNYWLIPVWVAVIVLLLLKIIPFDLDPAVGAAGSQTLDTPTPSSTLNPEYVHTAQSAESVARATVAAGQGELSILEITATSNAMAAIYTQTHVAIELGQAYTTQTAVARSTHAGATATAVEFNARQTRQVGAVIIRETQSAATVQAGQTATRQILAGVSDLATQSAIEAQTNEIQQRNRARSITIPAMVFLGLVITAAGAWLGFRLINQVIPALVLRLRTIRRPDGSVIFVLGKQRDKTDVVDPEKSLAPVIEIHPDQSAALAALPPGGDAVAVQERVTARAQLPKVYESLPANVRDLPGAESLGAPVFDQAPQLEILPPGLVERLAGEIENDLIVDAEFKSKE